MAQTIISFPFDLTPLHHIFAFDHEHTVAVSDKIAVFLGFANVHEFEIPGIGIMIFCIFLDNEIELF